MIRFIYLYGKRWSGLVGADILADLDEKVIFLEINMMSGVTKPEEGIVKAATKFAENDIKLHVDARFTPQYLRHCCILGSKLPTDKGCLGGGESGENGITGGDSYEWNMLFNNVGNYLGGSG